MITLDYIESIKKAASRDVELEFLVLDPGSDENLNVQSKNYPAGKTLREQLQQSLNELCRIRNELQEDKRHNIIIRLYDKIIRNGITVVYLESPDDIWLRVEDYAVGSEPNSRKSEAAYKKDDDNFYQYNIYEYNQLQKNSKIHSCDDNTLAVKG